ncbi:Polypeptide-transport-associated domain protein ShlB-type [Halothece sp. PCC 7418]|uniref:ShlB/FhaC/HecB family hemolysin secretion/activation protein n=1 Tax=Halothece sp. (strain PCC 7418) TaxID=65093 RepID=UPI0002A08914|nr:ShlB/FhaC/HecB family hemolysin secretion/activation protein [Halothece sp. PCC 7418]AFZ45544.1 Polypeptide-transport-associated domain protein ShlB-type [Halothece sp. PCC 7418]
MQWCLKSVLSSGLYLVIVNSVGSAIAAPELTGFDNSNRDSILLTQSSDPNPNRDRFIPSDSEDQPPETVDPSEISEPSVRPISPENLNLDPKQPITVNTIEVESSRVFDQAQLEAIVQDLEGTTVPLAEIVRAVNEITGLYVSQGYITSYAQLNRQSLAEGNGNLVIEIIEGSVTVEVEETDRLNPSYVRSRVELGTDQPLNVNKLEDQLRLLEANPLIDNVEATLKPKEEGVVGESILAIKVTETEPFFGNAYIDNYSPPSVGGERIGAKLSFANLTGVGDTISAEYYQTFNGGSQTADFLYRIPVNAKNGTIQLRAVLNDNEITEDPFDELDIEGDSERYELSYRQPLYRTFQEEFALSAGFAFRDGQSFVAGVPFSFQDGPQEGTSRTSVLKLGQDYVRRQASGAWAIRSQFNIGLDIFDATNNEGSTPDSQFVSWLLQAQRVQVLSPNNFLVVQADLQLTPDSLLPSEQFIIGGGQSVRGFRQNVRGGDNGFRLSVEDRITLERDEAGNPTLQVSPFVEMGSVWNSDDNPNSLPDQTFIIGIGSGVLWQPISNLEVRVDYGLPLVDLDDRGDDIQDDGIYFSTNYSF